MFAGIIEEAALVKSIQTTPTDARITIQSSLDHSSTKLGDSISVNGVCLTVVENVGGALSFEAVNETLKRTNLRFLKVGSKVNLERSLLVGERVHGHFVFGHVDGVVKLLSRMQDGASIRLSFDLPSDLRPFITTKGSITISGVSLTIGEVTSSSFSVYVIPHTAAVTILGSIELGDEVNVEVDMLARYVHSLLKGDVSREY